MTTNKQPDQLTEAQIAALKDCRGDHSHALHAFTPGTPEHEEAEEELVHMRKTNPRLYTKIVNWD
jgi:hypothetical protein